MEYTTQVQMVIDIETLIMKHVSACYDSEDTYCENPIYHITDWNAYEKSNYSPNYRESESIQGYQIVYHDIDRLPKLPNDISDYQNLTFTIEGKTCALVNFTDEKRNKFYKWTGNCILPNSVKLCEFVDSRIFEDDINFESKNDFQSILNDWFSYEYDRQNELKRKLHKVSTPTPLHQAEVKGFDNSTLNQIMNDDMIDLFLESEKRLKAEGFITSENKWIDGRGKNQTKTLYDLVNLILLLKEKKYLKLKFDKKYLKDNDYKNFFEVRYGYNLKEQFLKAKKDNVKSLETAKITFSYF